LEKPRSIFKQFPWLEVGSGKAALSRVLQQYPAKIKRGITWTAGLLN